MKAYISVGYKNRHKIDHIVFAIKECLEQFEIDSLVFVDAYLFSSGEENQMMDHAFAEIDSSDIIIA